MNPIDYPQSPASYTLDHYPSLKINWDYSYQKLTEFNQELNNKLKQQDISIVAAGSFGRLDASPESDLDYMILADQRDDKLEEVKHITIEICQKLNIKTPNPSGVFSEIIPLNEMVDEIGSNEDNMTKLAQRMLLLMESRTLYNDEKFRDVIKRILERYLGDVITDPTKECVFFLNDLIRYFRSICVNYQFNVWKEEQKWGMRNLKLRHSRVLIYAGLLFLILNASKGSKIGKSKLNYMLERMELTPLEKIANVYIDCGDHSLKRVLGIYNTFMHKMSDPRIRNDLRVDYDDRYNNPHYAELKVTSDALQTELTRFVLHHKFNWTEQIFEYLLF